MLKQASHHPERPSDTQVSNGRYRYQRNALPVGSLPLKLSEALPVQLAACAARFINLARGASCSTAGVGTGYQVPVRVPFDTLVRYFNAIHPSGCNDVEYRYCTGTMIRLYQRPPERQ